MTHNPTEDFACRHLSRAAIAADLNEFYRSQDGYDHTKFLGQNDSRLTADICQRYATLVGSLDARFADGGLDYDEEMDEIRSKILGDLGMGIDRYRPVTTATVRVTLDYVVNTDKPMTIEAIEADLISSIIPVVGRRFIGSNYKATLVNIVSTETETTN